MWPWMLAGAVSGMAILTRATGLILVGVVGLALMLRIVSEIRSGQRVGLVIRRATGSGVIWIASTVGTIYLLLPALWVAPAQTLNKLWSWSSDAATEGHENPTFFRGIHHDDPGILVYPTVLAWRTSPVEWLGMALLLILGFWAWRRRSKTSMVNGRFLIICVVFAIVYVAAMSMGAKKFDRYILPVFPIIAVLTAQGLVLGKHWLTSRNSVGWRRIGHTLVIVAVVAQALSWNSSRPYRLDYYNPILGGAQQAQHVLQMGWGQGGDEVVQYLQEQAAVDPITVQTSAVPSAFTYFLEEESPIQFRSFGLTTPAGWYETDYYVAGIQQTQRELSPAFNLMTGNTPVYSVEIGGVSYFDIYNVRNLPLPDALATPTACNLTFGEAVTLMQIVGRDETIDFYFLSTVATSDDQIVFEIGIDWDDGTSRMESRALAPASEGNMSRLTVPYQHSDAPLKEATITIRASSDSQLLPVSSPWMDQGQSGETHSECYYSEPPV